LEEEEEEEEEERLDTLMSPRTRKWTDVPDRAVRRTTTLSPTEGGGCTKEYILLCVEEQQFFFASKIHIKNQSKKEAPETSNIKKNKCSFYCEPYFQVFDFWVYVYATETLSRRGRVVRFYQEIICPYDLPLYSSQVKAFGCYSKHKNM